LTLQEEQAAFDSQLNDLLKEHRGEFVLFKDGRPVGFFEDHVSAYAAGLEKFGVGAVFLVAPVHPQSHQPISFAWEAGVMFG
jgi:hypothetical protein